MYIVSMQQAMHHWMQLDKSCKFGLQYLSEQQTAYADAFPAHEWALEPHGLHRCHPDSLLVKYPVLQGHELVTEQ